MNDYFIKDVQARLDLSIGTVLTQPTLQDGFPTVINAQAYSDGSDNPIFGGTTEKGFNCFMWMALYPLPEDVEEWDISIFIRNTDYELSIRILHYMRPYRFDILNPIGDVYHGLPEKGRQWMDKNFPQMQDAAFQVVPAQSPQGLIHYQSGF